MKREQLKRQIEKLQEQMDYLKKQLELCPIDGRVQKGELYWYVDVDGLDISTVDAYGGFDEKAYLMGNYFKTQEEAVKYSKNQQTKMKLKRLAESLNGDATISWENQNQQKYYLYYDNFNKRLCQDANQNHQSQRIYCLNDEFKLRAIQEIGEDDLIDYIKSGV